MTEFNMEEFERRIRFEEGIKKDVEHIKGEIEAHLKDEEKNMEKFERVQESHNNILHRVNNVEDDISEIEKENKEDCEKISNIKDDIDDIKTKLLIFKIVIAAIAVAVLFTLTSNPIIFKLVKPLISLFT